MVERQRLQSMKKVKSASKRKLKSSKNKTIHTKQRTKQQQRKGSKRSISKAMGCFICSTIFKVKYYYFMTNLLKNYHLHKINYKPFIISTVIPNLIIYLLY